MTTSHKELLHFAEKQCRNENEAARRAAISRGWYSIYHRFYGLLNDYSIPAPRRSSHNALLQIIFNANGRIDDDDIEFISENITDCEHFRIESDYDLDIDIPMSSSYESYLLIHKCYSKLESAIINPETQSGLVEAAKHILVNW